MKFIVIDCRCAIGVILSEAIKLERDKTIRRLIAIKELLNSNYNNIKKAEDKDEETIKRINFQSYEIYCIQNTLTSGHKNII